jgi:hypothetical protein
MKKSTTAPSDMADEPVVVQSDDGSAQREERDRFVDRLMQMPLGNA